METVTDADNRCFSACSSSSTPPVFSADSTTPTVSLFSEMLESLISESQGPVVVENVVSLTTPDLGDFSGALVSFPLDVSLQSCGEETRHPLEIEPPEVQLPSGTMVLFTQETGTHDSETHNDWAFQDTRTQHITNMGAVPGTGVVPLRVAPSQSLLDFPKGEGLKGVERWPEKMFSSVST